MGFIKKFLFLTLIVAGTLGIVWISDFVGEPGRDNVSSLESPSFDKEVIKIDQRELKVEVADTDEKRTTGLSWRESMEDDEGMLFVFQTPNVYFFWMKDMLFPIDIIWINEDKMVIDIDHNVSPDSYPDTFFPGDHVKYVVEANANWSEKNGVNIGDHFEL